MRGLPDQALAAPTSPPADHQEHEDNGQKDDDHHRNELPTCQEQKKILQSEKIIGHDRRPVELDFPGVTKIDSGNEAGNGRKGASETARKTIAGRGKEQMRCQVPCICAFFDCDMEDHLTDNLDQGIPKDDKADDDAPSQEV